MFWRCFRIIAKIACYFHDVCLSACISMAPTGRIYVKFDTCVFHENLLRKSKFGYTWALYMKTCILLLSVTLNCHKSALYD